MVTTRALILFASSVMLNASLAAVSELAFQSRDPKLWWRSTKGHESAASGADSDEPAFPAPSDRFTEREASADCGLMKKKSWSGCLWVGPRLVDLSGVGAHPEREPHGAGSLGGPRLRDDGISARLQRYEVLVLYVGAEGGEQSNAEGAPGAQRDSNGALNRPERNTRLSPAHRSRQSRKNTPQLCSTDEVIEENSQPSVLKPFNQTTASLGKV